MYLLSEFNIKPRLPIALYCDNKTAEHIAVNPLFHKRMKHLEIDCHIVRDQVEKSSFPLFTFLTNINWSISLPNLSTLISFKTTCSRWDCMTSMRLHLEGGHDRIKF